MNFSEQELLWACKAYILEQYSNSKILKESASKSKNFIQFVKNMDMNTAKYILEKITHVGSTPISSFEKDPSKIERLEKGTDVAKRLAAQIKAALDMNKREEGLKNTLLKKYGIKMVIATLAATLAVVGYMLYKRYKDACRKSCDRSQDKAKCIKDCRIAAARQSIIHLKTERSKCGSNGNCQKKFDNQISKWENKMKHHLK